ncbi:hypothetical protein FA09DRAFT_168867 [Tilletiopsis washingtonensis]|uniref:Uncharacterized protein n=1 Tax=Tilletiopsis washingtonensis TaxID=58919 RepID=A0A316Z1J8_9BASI|nr:hypothetical protein FA09DRAFT_168867 [Tilletiopsis washingtonensis]PWN94792.1 hypothetical protein FA09DRAFT_168867 [Tilletiopsis washingtonensis]
MSDLLEAVQSHLSHVYTHPSHLSLSTPLYSGHTPLAPGLCLLRHPFVSTLVIGCPTLLCPLAIASAVASTQVRGAAARTHPSGPRCLALLTRQSLNQMSVGLRMLCIA